MNTLRLALYFWIEFREGYGEESISKLSVSWSFFQPKTKKKKIGNLSKGRQVN